MASLIHCPHCGVRPKEEFYIKGDAGIIRPAADASDKEWTDYMFFRRNPVGRYSELWHHLSGCRRWLVVERDTVSHQVYAVTDAAALRERGAA
jgi:sarcosine oxidase subunit delta